MKNAMFLVVLVIIYLGAASIGVAIFGEGGNAALFGSIVGGIGFVCFYSLILKKDDDNN